MRADDEVVTIDQRNAADLAVREQNARLAAIVETNAGIAAADVPLETVLPMIAERARALTRGDAATVRLLEGELLVERATAGEPPAVASLESRIDVPLIRGGQTVGSLEVTKTDGITESDRLTVELLAVVLSSAIGEEAEREARREQLEALSRFDAIFASAPIGIGLLSLDGRFQNTNAAMREISGFSAEELGSQNVLDYTAPEDVDEVTRLFTEMLAGKHDSYRHELQLFAKDGTRVWVDTATALLRDANGKPQVAVSMAQNITQRRAAEEELRQSQKTEAIGQLTAGIAHDFNNLLLGMLGNTELAKAEVGPAGPAAEFLTQIEESARRAATLTAQLLAFGRRQTLQPQPVVLNTLISETVALLERVLGERIEIVMRLEPDLDAAKADPGQMQQVLLNLALNARDAMPEGGRLTIGTRNIELGDADAVGGALEPGRYVVLSVEDEGCGMADGVLEQIFDPFFTTKGVGDGTGLGLSSAHGIVKQSGGHIGVTTTPGEGSGFDVYLPALTLAPSEQAEPDVRRVPSRLPAGAGKRILVVEDEEVVRTLLARMLERLGYSVESAPDPSIALPLLQERGHEFALVISDMVMPHATGAEFAREVGRSRPELPFVFMSGYSDEIEAQAGAVAGHPFLTKPFTSDVLEAAVTATIGTAA